MPPAKRQGATPTTQKAPKKLKTSNWRRDPNPPTLASQGKAAEASKKSTTVETPKDPTASAPLTVPAVEDGTQDPETQNPPPPAELLPCLPPPGPGPPTIPEEPAVQHPPTNPPHDSSRGLEDNTQEAFFLRHVDELRELSDQHLLHHYLEEGVMGLFGEITELARDRLQNQLDRWIRDKRIENPHGDLGPLILNESFLLGPEMDISPLSRSDIPGAEALVPSEKRMPEEEAQALLDRITSTAMEGMPVPSQWSSLEGALRLVLSSPALISKDRILDHLVKGYISLALRRHVVLSALEALTPTQDHNPEGLPAWISQALLMGCVRDFCGLKEDALYQDVVLNVPALLFSHLGARRWGVAAKILNAFFKDVVAKRLPERVQSLFTESLSDHTTLAWGDIVSYALRELPGFEGGPRYYAVRHSDVFNEDWGKLLGQWGPLRVLVWTEDPGDPASGLRESPLDLYEAAVTRERDGWLKEGAPLTSWDHERKAYLRQARNLTADMKGELEAYGKRGGGTTGKEK